MDARSESNLVQVHPDLCKVIRGAAQTPQPFEVIYGIRSLAAEQAAVASGHSHTLHSRHLPNKDGVACAVDVAALINGKVSFAPGQEAAVFGQINAQIQASAVALNIHVQWGGAPVGAWVDGIVSHFRDYGHFQLEWRDYP
jgi:peptidoglycan L-alanyl-D-glutamate endopeptidase CwlK